MKKITLHRPKESFNKNCSYEILLGKHTLTSLNNGEAKTIEIPEEWSNEPLKAKIQWCGSEKMDLKSITENSKISVSGNKFLNGKMPLFGAIFPLIGLITFNFHVVSKNVGIAIFLLFLFGIIATITIWRNKWLKLKIR